MAENTETGPAGEQQDDPASSFAGAHLEGLIAERDRFKELALRARAEFENFQKRSNRDLQVERQYAVQPLAADLLPVLDNLDRAIDSARGKDDAKGIVEGIELVRKQFFDAFVKHGIERIAPTDAPFDPNFHQAVLQVPTAEKPPMTVLQTLQTGYRLKDRVIRPAQVMVATAPIGPASPDNVETEDEINV